MPVSGCLPKALILTLSSRDHFLNKILKLFFFFWAKRLNFLKLFLRISVRFSDQKMQYFKIGAWKEQKVVILKEQN